MGTYIYSKNNILFNENRMSYNQWDIMHQYVIELNTRSTLMDKSCDTLKYKRS